MLDLFLENLHCMFIDMAFYIMLGLFFVGLLNTYVKRDKVLGMLGKDDVASVVKASVIGVPLPLCSCGVVPTAVELKKSGASNGAVTSFLVSTPQTGVDSIIATYSLMGMIMAVFRPLAAFASGIITGTLVNIFAKDEKINVEVKSSCCSSDSVETSCCSSTPVEETCCCSSTPVEESCCSTPVVSSCCSSKGNDVSTLSGGAKVLRVFKYAYGEFLDDISLHFILGLLLATVIATFVPADFFVNLGLNSGIVSMIAMVLIGLPMYICSTSSIPIALSLLGKGLSLGSVFVFLFTGPVTNIASILMLSTVLGKKITIMYISIVIACSIGFGLLLDYFISVSDLDIASQIGSSAHHSGPFMEIIAVIFFLLLVKSLIKVIPKKFAKA